ncbi:hypothetical protein [Methylobacterium sp. GC_Met_2]|uniref:hypothetical protein n=1 Tax=Methylobacterium sp. GC_Met_2 TaxID=2937376 RepID=UPI00226B5BE3|nr:hypothetical protein [Methylobacterium sp. GC_Met_2]
MALIPSVLSLNFASNAAVAAQMSFVHRRNRAACELLAGIAACLLVAGGGFLLIHRASLARFHDDGAARMMPAAPASLRTPPSLAALARGSVHCLSLLSRGARER